MEFLDAAGITTGALVPLHDVQEKTNTIHELFHLHRKWLPAGLKKTRGQDGGGSEQRSLSAIVSQVRGTTRQLVDLVSKETSPARGRRADDKSLFIQTTLSNGCRGR